MDEGVLRAYASALCSGVVHPTRQPLAALIALHHLNRWVLISLVQTYSFFVHPEISICWMPRRYTAHSCGSLQLPLASSAHVVSVVEVRWNNWSIGYDATNSRRWGNLHLRCLFLTSFDQRTSLYPPLVVVCRLQIWCNFMQRKKCLLRGWGGGKNSWGNNVFLQ